jgi:hypothetical protein
MAEDLKLKRRELMQKFGARRYLTDQADKDWATVKRIASTDDPVECLETFSYVNTLEHKKLEMRIAFLEKLIGIIHDQFDEKQWLTIMKEANVIKLEDLVPRLKKKRKR